jgi:integrase
MENAKIIDFSKGKTHNHQPKTPDRLNAGKTGRVYGRGGKLWVDFYYLGQRVRERSGLDDTRANREFLRKKLDLIVSQIDNGVFEFGKSFSHSKKVAHFTSLEGRTFRKDPKDITFNKYAEQWWTEMHPGMSASQARDYASILKVHLVPYFGQQPFSEFRPVLMKKFLSHLKTKKTPGGNPLSPKRIHNILIPLRVIFKDACGEFDWAELPDPFIGLKLPQVKRLRIYPFTMVEWVKLMEFIPAWYRPYFELAVLTGMRPSEQVALKWSAVDDRFIHVELSRVRNLEKAELKTAASNRRIEIRPSMKKVLEEQQTLMANLRSSYVFLNMEGKPILQDKLRELWMRAMKKSQLPYRRMYETRHTFASWALAAGESPEWVARTLGHVNTSMIYKTYGRYIPNLTRQDGSALEGLLGGTENEKGNPDRHNLRHNGQNPGHLDEVTTLIS